MNQNTFAIRNATIGDETPVQELIFSVLREYGLKPDPEGTDADLKDLQSSYTNHQGVFRIVADSGGRIFGCGGLLPLGNGDVELRKMYMLPEVRGQGIGKQLLEDLIGISRTQGHKRIVLDTASVLKEAIGLYRKRGFQPYDNPHRVWRCDHSFFLHIDG